MTVSLMAPGRFAFSRLAEQHAYESAAAYAAGTVYRTTEYRAYDDFDRLLELTLPAGEGTQYSEYDDKGKLLMRYGLEADGSTPGANTYPTLYSYDATGNLSTLTTYQGGIDQASSSPSVTTWEYDLRGRLQRKSYPDAGEITYTYYANDRLKTRSNVLRAKLRPTKIANLVAYDFSKSAGLLRTKLACSVIRLRRRLCRTL